MHDSKVEVWDGGMGTELYERGFYINRLFEELNVSNPTDVLGVHTAYLKAGASVVTTNTFSVNRFVLEKFGIQNDQEKLLHAAVTLAKKACEGHKSSTKTEALVALSFGPSGGLMEPLGPLSKTEVRAEFESLARLHLKLPQGERADRYVLETFSNLDELEEAVAGIRAADTSTPLFVSITLHDPEGAAERVMQYARKFGSRKDIQGMGFNCSEGPAGLLDAVRTLRPLTEHAILVEPNAGIPRQINGRYFYMTSPDYLAKYAKRFVEAGANAVGGCCGTGPDHIEAIANAVRMLDVKLKTEVSHRFEKIEVGPDQKSSDWGLRKKSRIGSVFAQGSPLITVELQSPKGASIDRFVQDLRRLAESGVRFVNVPDGARASTRISSLHLAAHVNLRSDIGLTILPHLTSRDRNLIALQADLLGASVNEVHDLLLITGDPPKLGVSKEATAVYDIDSIGLTYLAHRLNQGFNGAGEKIPQSTQFGIGVASNPTAVNLSLEIERFKYKVESGADFAVTQPIFDPESFMRWKETISGFYRPHVVGIWPFASLRNAEFMAHEVPGVHVPAWALKRMAKWSDDPASASKEGVAIALEVIEALKAHCQGFAVSAPLGKIDPVLEILRS
jgi:methionine synthase / methylenetetrahydrofolate reductase(NADPH)